MRAMLVAALFLAGCASPLDAAPTHEPEKRTSYFQSTMTLAPTLQTNQSVVRTGGFYEAWAAGDDYPTWVADPLGRDVLVTSATVTLFLQVSGPVIENERFPDIMVYGGSGEAWMAFASRTDFIAFVPGQVYEMELTLGMPFGGLWVPGNKGFGLKVVPVMFQQDDTADVEILLGGDRSASRVSWTTLAIDLPNATPTRGAATGEVVGTIYAGPAAPPTTSHRTPLTLGRDVVWIVAWMNTTDALGVPDIDLSIVAPNGTQIATSGTPTPQEAIRVALPNLVMAGEYGLVVTTAGSPRAEFNLEWIVGRH